MINKQFEAVYPQPQDLTWLEYDAAGDCYRFKSDESAGSVVAVIAFHSVNAAYATARHILTDGSV